MSERVIEDELLTAPQVAKFLKWHLAVVYLKTSKGEIPGRVKIGGSIRFRRSAIEQWIIDGTEDGVTKSEG